MGERQRAHRVGLAPGVVAEGRDALAPVLEDDEDVEAGLRYLHALVEGQRLAADRLVLVVEVADDGMDADLAASS